MRHRGWIATCVLGAIIGTGLAAVSARLHRSISPDRVAERLYRSLARSTDTLYRVQVDHTHWSILGRRFRLEGLRITPDDARLAAHRRAGVPDGSVYSVTIPSF